jgi:hypothetical protein
VVTAEHDGVFEAASFRIVAKEWLAFAAANENEAQSREESAGFFERVDEQLLGAMFVHAGDAADGDVVGGEREEGAGGAVLRVVTGWPESGGVDDAGEAGT